MRTAPFVRAVVCAAVGALACQSAAGEPAAPKAWTLSFTGLGPVHVGMTVRQAAKAAKLPLEEGGPPDHPDCQYAFAEALPDVRFMVMGGKIVRIDVRAGDFATARGARVGMAERDVKSLHPKVRTEPHHYDEAGHYLVLTSGNGRHAMRFETDGKVVTDIIVGEREPVGFVEGCL